MYLLKDQNSYEGGENAWYTLFVHALNLLTIYCVTEADDVYVNIKTDCDVRYNPLRTRAYGTLWLTFAVNNYTNRYA